MTSRSPYRADVDGLRAVAVLAVLLFHAGIGLPGGYTGVDIFFVISGYLITGLIRRAVEQGEFSLLEFWHRRIRRILPAVAVAVAAVILVGMAVLLRADLLNLARAACAQGLMVANVYFWQQTGYFAPDAESMPLLHTWSLAVEEQFYLIYPILFAWMWRRNRMWARWALLGVFAASLALSIVMTPGYQAASFYLLPARAWELLLGALLALDFARPIARQGIREAVGWAGVALIAYTFVAYDASTRFPGLGALPPCLGTAAIIHANGQGATTVGRVLSWRPVVFIGLISYSLYLWHWPLLVYLDYVVVGRPEVWARLPMVGLSVVAAILSWRWVETPIRKRQLFQRRGSVFAAGLFTTTMMLALAGGILWAEGSPRAPSTAPVGGRAYFGIVHTTDHARSDDLAVLGAKPSTPERPLFVLWGDSHAQALAPVLDLLAREHGRFGYAAFRPSVTPLLGTWRPVRDRTSIEYNDQVLAFIRRHRPRHVLLASRWSVNYDGRPDGRMDSLIVDQHTATVSVEAAHEAFRRGLRRTLAALADMDINVWVVKEVPLQPDNVPRMVAVAGRLGRDVAQLGAKRDEYLRQQTFIDAVLAEAQLSTARVLDPNRYLFHSHGRAILVNQGRPTYRDDDHLSPAGALLLRPMFADLFAAPPLASEPEGHGRSAGLGVVEKPLLFGLTPAAQAGGDVVPYGGEPLGTPGTIGRP